MPSRDRSGPSSQPFWHGVRGLPPAMSSSPAAICCSPSRGFNHLWTIPCQPQRLPSCIGLQKRTTTLALQLMRLHCPVDNRINFDSNTPPESPPTPATPATPHRRLHALDPAHLPQSTSCHHFRVRLPLRLGLPPLVARRSLSPTSSGWLRSPARTFMASHTVQNYRTRTDSDGLR